jgi:alpha-1,6-mannosyltransferase
MPFLVVAAAMAVVYALWVAWVPLLPDNVFIPLLDLGKLTGYTWQSAALFLLIVLSLYTLYSIGYRLTATGGVRLRAVFGLGGVLCFELLWAYPATAVDVFGYIADGRLLALHRVNPFVRTPIEFPADSILPYLAFPDEPSQYGPLWALLGGAISSLSRGDLLTEVLAYKAVSALAHLGGAGLIYLIAARLGAGSLRARASAYLYLCNPMLLWEMVGNAHNDGVMMLLGLVAVWLFVTARDRLVVLAAAAAALVKLPVALIGPALVVGLWRRAPARAIEATLLGMLMIGVVYRPFWEGPQTLTALRRSDLFTASMASVVRLALEPGLGLVDATTAARSLSLGTFGAVLVASVWMAARAQSDRDVLRSAYVVLLGGLLLATTWFQAWYVVWPFSLAAALGAPRRHLEVALLSLGGLLQYFVFIYLWVMGAFPPGDNLGVQTAAYLAIIGPLLVGLAARAVQPLGGSPPGIPCGAWKRS